MQDVVKEETAQSPAPDSAARKEMRQALAEVGRVRPYLYIALIGVVLLSAIEVPSAWGVLEWGETTAFRLIFLSAYSVLILVAIWWLDRNPTPPTVGLALLHTAGTVVALARSEAPLELESLVRSSFWAVYFWVIAISAYRLSRAARANPDFYTSKWMRGESGADAGAHQARALKENFERKLRERRRLLFVGGMLGLFLLSGFVGLLARGSDS